MLRKPHVRISRIHPTTIAAFLSLACTVWALWLAPVAWNSLPQNILQPSRQAPDGPEKRQPVITAKPPVVPVGHAGIDCAKIPCMALTFDDGPNPITTPQILDILDRQQVHATFFVVGSRIADQGPLLRRMYSAGHEIGSHSWSHPDLTTLSPAQIMRQVNLTQAAIISEGIPAPSLFRPPYGAVNAMVKNSIPMTLAMWNIDPLDWETKDPAKVRDAILAHARPGAVIDLHDIYPVTVQSLEGTIEALKPRYQLVTFSELFNLDSGQRGEYFGR